MCPVSKKACSIQAKAASGKCSLRFFDVALDLFTMGIKTSMFNSSQAHIREAQVHAFELRRFAL